ncbi:TrmH family RNA methyltransferase [Sphingomonas sp. H39-1-10]|uniref:TrmH family RNA methyltransferase n=1 Tax=Sphingomonas TaxID=13687 RepID=UPI0008880036|nr:MULTISPECIES: TrmH family RNA methyltransferase [Sphingomonas]MDF0486861.1 TrmH family RNA methyltransferase [Sphingomonas pollutisoli]SDA34861.1 tRNA/rRNA methyltransferase [Sphingomonas sp. NFR15]
MSFWVYILRCADGSYYTGHTDNLETRIGQHQSGQIEGYTRSRLPVELMWSQDFPSRVEALEAEQRIKPWSRAKKEALIASDWAALSVAAMPPSERRERQHAVPRLRSGRTEDEGASISPPVRAERSRGTAPAPSPGEAEAPRTTPPPVIVLVRPQLGENIGKAARAMLNFGLTEMRLVAPRDGWPNPAAGPAASGADVVLEQAQVFDTLAEAIADCPNVYATTVRKRGVTKPVVTPEVAARAIHAGPGRTAILFGPERSGLETDDVAVAREIITVPINPEFGSLNLAQAVILVAYEWSKGIALAQPPEVDLPEPAPQEDLDGMIAQLDAMLVDANFFYPPDRTVATRRTLRTLLTKPGWSSQEVRTLRGVLSALAGAKRKKEPREK